MDHGNPFRPLSWAKTEGFVYAEKTQSDIELVTVKRKRQRSRKEPRKVTLTTRDYQFKVGSDVHYGSEQSKSYNEGDWVRGRVRHKVLDGGGYATSVWYDASDPSKNTLEEPNLLSILFPLLFPALYLPFPLLFFYMAIRCFRGNDSTDAEDNLLRGKDSHSDNPHSKTGLNCRVRKATQRDSGANCGNCMDRAVTGTWYCPVHCINVDNSLICHRYKPCRNSFGKGFSAVSTPIR